jgi:iron complex outermembrane receptor protein
LVWADRLVVIRGSFTDTRHDLVFGASRQRDRGRFELVEASLSETNRANTWLVGAAVERDQYRVKDLDGFDYSYTMPGLFVQDELAPARWFALSASARAGFHPAFGTFLDGRVSTLFRPGREWTVRLSAGTGHAPPVPRNESTDVVGLSRVRPFRGVVPEVARNAILDAAWSDGPWEVDGLIFGSVVKHPLILRDFSPEPGRIEFVSAGTPARTYGGEFLARVHRGPVQAIASYTYVHSMGEDSTSTMRRHIPLTPWHSAELAGIWEKEGRGRFGIEVSYTGRQRLEDDPYRDVGRQYVTVNALGEVRIGPASLFVNAIDLTDVRQSWFDPLIRATQAPDGSWTTDPWAPLEGRVFNAGARWEF